MKKTRFLRTIGVVMLVIGMLFVSCDQFFDPPYTEMSANEGVELNSRDYLALLKTQNNHKVSLEELQDIVLNTINNSEMGRSVATSRSVITGIRKMPLAGEWHFSSSGTIRSAARSLENEQVEVYEFAIGSSENGNEGFVFASDDIRIGHILAIADGSLEDASEEFAVFLNASLQDYISAAIIDYDSITEEEIEAAFEKLAEQSEGARSTGTVTINGYPANSTFALLGWSNNLVIQKAPLLATKWGQGTQGTYTGSAPYNHVYNNYVQYNMGNIDYVTGCGPTAIAQIVAYHNYINLNQNAINYKPAATTGNSNLTSIIGDWNGTYNLSLIRNLETITSSSTAAARGQVAALMLHAGLLANASYSTNGTSVSESASIPVFQNFGYVIELQNFNNATSITPPSSSNYNSTLGYYYTNTYTITYNVEPNVIKNNLNLNRPIYAQGLLGYNQPGHAWVIDGYGDMTQYYEYYRSYYSNEVHRERYYTLTNTLMVHCNMGNNGNGNGWYVYGLFDVSNRFHIDGYDTSSQPYNFSTSTGIIIPRLP